MCGQYYHALQGSRSQSYRGGHAGRHYAAASAYLKESRDFPPRADTPPLLRCAYAAMQEVGYDRLPHASRLRQAARCRARRKMMQRRRPALRLPRRRAPRSHGTLEARMLHNAARCVRGNTLPRYDSHAERHAGVMPQMRYAPATSEPLAEARCGCVTRCAATYAPPLVAAAAPPRVLFRLRMSRAPARWRR